MDKRFIAFSFLLSAKNPILLINKNLKGEKAINIIKQNLDIKIFDNLYNFIKNRDVGFHDMQNIGVITKGQIDKKIVYEFPSIHIIKYKIFPNLNNPKWLVPDSKHFLLKSRLIKPTKLISKFIWRLYLTLQKFQVGDLLFPYSLYLLSNSNNAFHGTLLNEKNIIQSDIKYVAFYLGTYGPFQKFTVEFMNVKGITIKYMKFACLEDSMERIRAEINALKTLNKVNLRNVQFPTLLSKGKFKLGKNMFSYLIQTSAPENFNTIDSVLNEFHINYLVELFTSTKIDKIDIEKVLHEIMHRLAEIKDDLNYDIYEKIKSIINENEKEFKNKNLILGFSQGDCSPWNMYRNNNSIFVFDWEIAEYRTPLWDLWNYIIHSQLLIYKKKYKIVINNLLHSKIVELYINYLGKETRVNIKLYLNIFIIENFIYYTKYNKLELKYNYYISKANYIIIDFFNWYFNNEKDITDK